MLWLNDIMRPRRASTSDSRCPSATKYSLTCSCVKGDTVITRYSEKLVAYRFINTDRDEMYIVTSGAVLDTSSSFSRIEGKRLPLTSSRPSRSTAPPAGPLLLIYSVTLSNELTSLRLIKPFEIPWE